MSPTAIPINIWTMPGGPSAGPERTVREAGVTGGVRCSSRNLRRKWGPETRWRQRLQTREARTRSAGSCGGNRRSSSISAGGGGGVVVGCGGREGLDGPSASRRMKRPKAQPSQVEWRLWLTGWASSLSSSIVVGGGAMAGCGARVFFIYLF